MILSIFSPIVPVNEEAEPDAGEQRGYERSHNSSLVEDSHSEAERESGQNGDAADLGYVKCEFHAIGFPSWSRTSCVQ